MMSDYAFNMSIYFGPPVIVEKPETPIKNHRLLK